MDEMNDDDQTENSEQNKQIQLINERIDYLNSIINSLVIQNLACGNIPKVRPGVEMKVESLIKLKEELDFMISQTLKHESSIPDSKKKQSS